MTSGFCGCDANGWARNYMTDTGTTDLQNAVETQHSCRATFAQTVPVRETFHGQPVWEGVVHVFDLEGHSTATQAYAWSSAIEGSTERRYYAVLQIGAIETPLDAVRAAIVAEHKAQRK
jgi:hypothetical protein